MARDAVIVSTARTPIGRAYKGAFNATPGATLGALSLAPAIERAGIVELNPQGEPFDANLHEAMAAQPSATAEPNSVLAVVQRGYSLNGRLLRAARVVIARAPE